LGKGEEGKGRTSFLKKRSKKPLLSPVFEPQFCGHSTAGGLRRKIYPQITQINAEEEKSALICVICG
jgi:hypothetical protein